MDTIRIKPSRIRRMKEIDNLNKELKEVFDEFKEHRRDRQRLARKARKMANKVQKYYPDLRLTENSSELGLHDQLEDIARALYLSNDSSDEDPMNTTSSLFEKLFDFFRRISHVPWA